MLKRPSFFLSVMAVACVNVPAMAAIRIDFSDSVGVAGSPGAPGFELSRTGPVGISNALEIGRSQAVATENLNFLRITSATSLNQGADVMGYIVVFPRLEIAINPNDPPAGVFIDRYTMRFQGGGASQDDGFAIYADNDTNLSNPFLRADMHLTDAVLLTLGSSGAIESTVGINLTNVELPQGPAGVATLAEFRDAANATANGADFVASISSAGAGLSARIMTGSTITGSAAGSIFAVPEPSTFVLLLGAAALFLRRRRRLS